MSSSSAARWNSARSEPSFWRVSFWLSCQVFVDVGGDFRDEANHHVLRGAVVVEDAEAMLEKCLQVEVRRRVELESFKCDV